VVEFRTVTKEYSNGTVALNDINLNLDKGEFANTIVVYINKLCPIKT
jgi:ABC-type ATPase involved in cell division